MLTRTQIASILMFASATAALALSQFPTFRTVQAPADIPVYNQTLEVRFIGDSLHGARAGIFQPRDFNIVTWLESNVYVVRFANSEFIVDAVSIKDPTAAILNVTKDLVFEAESNGSYTVVVSGHYMYGVPVPWGSPEKAGTGAGGYSASVDDTVDISITPLVPKTETYKAYSQAWLVTPLFCLFGTLIAFRKKFRAYGSSEYRND